MVTMVSLENRKQLFLLNLLIFLTFDLMLLGAGVRTMDAGLTCPDWPLCFGKPIPEYHFGVYLEFIHRAIAGLLSIVFVVFFTLVWRNKSLKSLRLSLLVGLFLLIAQVIMGGLTVLKLLDSIIVTLHLSLATAFLLNLYVVKQKLVLDVNKNKFLIKAAVWQKVFKANIILGIVFVLLQIVLGGLVASTYSGLICVDFPTCNGQLFPEMTGPVAIQMLHRFGAYWLALLSVILFVFSIFYSKKIGLNKKQRVLGVKVFLLICSQVAIGILNLKFLIPAWLSVVHLGVALSILLTLVQLLYKIKQKN